MKIALIIPLFRQTENWPKLLKGIENQSKTPDIVYMMLDRPIEGEIEKYQQINEGSKLKDILKIIPVIEPPKHIGNRDNKELFLTPYIRNLGINNAVNDKCDIFVFIDGDCIPQKALIESHAKKCSQDLPVLTVGRRRESIYKWKDKREVLPEYCHLELFRDRDYLITTPELLYASMIVWSCNIAMNLKSINLLRAFNTKYYNRDEVFCSEFNGSWGGEDGFLGLQAWHCRVFINMIGNKASGIEHIDHPRPDEKYTMKHADFFKRQAEVLRRKMVINPLGLEFYSSNKSLL